MVRITSENGEKIYVFEATSVQNKNTKATTQLTIWLLLNGWTQCVRAAIHEASVAFPHPIFH